MNYTDMLPGHLYTIEYAGVPSPYFVWVKEIKKEKVICRGYLNGDYPTHYNGEFGYVKSFQSIRPATPEEITNFRKHFPDFKLPEPQIVNNYELF